MKKLSNKMKEKLLYSRVRRSLEEPLRAYVSDIAQRRCEHDAVEYQRTTNWTITRQVSRLHMPTRITAGTTRMFMAVARTEVLTLLKHAKNEIDEAKRADQAAEILKCLHDSLQENEGIVREFNDRLFIEFGQYLIRDVIVRWTGDSHTKLNDCIEVFFICGPAEDSFLVITKSLSSDR